MVLDFISLFPCGLIRHLSSDSYIKWEGMGWGISWHSEVESSVMAVQSSIRGNVNTGHKQFLGICDYQQDDIADFMYTVGMTDW